MWANNCRCSGLPYGVSAAELSMSAENVVDAAQVVLVAACITEWTGCLECRQAFATLLQRSVEILEAAAEVATKKWTEL